MVVLLCLAQVVQKFEKIAQSYPDSSFLASASQKEGQACPCSWCSWAVGRRDVIVASESSPKDEHWVVCPVSLVQIPADLALFSALPFHVLQ